MYDLIVVGARIAGSPLAMLLARSGHKVLLVDQAVFPNDYILSNHVVWTAGIEFLRQWGVLKTIEASGCPPLRRFALDFGALQLAGTPPPSGPTDASYAPRRVVLDQALLDAALAARVEFREGFTVEELLHDNGKVVGIRGRDRHGKFVTERAKLVVGADGTRSVIARLVQANEYNCRPANAMTFWAYHSGFARTDADVEFYVRPHRTVYVFRTNDGLTQIGVNWTAKEYPVVSQDPEKHYLEALREHTPSVASRVQDAKRESAFAGGVRENYYRKPFGPGWALVGDAGSGYEPYAAHGITNSFRQASLLADAIHRGFSSGADPETAMAEFERQRNDAEYPYYDLACQFAAQEPPSNDLVQLLMAVVKKQSYIDAFIGNFTQTTSPAKFFAPENVGAMMKG